MSRHAVMRSFGAPYFCATQDDLSFMDAASLPVGGLAESGMEFRVLTLPPQSASADEIHPLFSFHEAGPSGGIMLEYGITPSGRFKAVNSLGTTISTQVGRIVADGQWHSVRVAYDGGTGDFYFQLDADALVATVDAGSLLVPSAGRLGRVMLFNGRDGLARTAADIRYADAGFSPGPALASWDFPNHALSAPASTKTGLSNQVMDLTPQWHQSFVRSYGEPPIDTNPRVGYEVVVTTDYTLRAMPTTVYNRVGAA